MGFFDFFLVLEKKKIGGERERNGQNSFLHVLGCPPMYGEIEISLVFSPIFSNCLDENARQNCLSPRTGSVLALLGCLAVNRRACS